MKKSFTLIEIILIVVIISVSTGVGLAYYHNFNEEKKLERETLRFYDVLLLTQKKAVSGDQSNILTCASFSGYQLQYSNNGYNFALCCAEDCSGENQILIKSYTFADNIILLEAGSVRFRPVTGETDLTDSLTLNFKNQILSKCQSISITPAGLIDIDLQKKNCS